MLRGSRFNNTREFHWNGKETCVGIGGWFKNFPIGSLGFLNIECPHSPCHIDEERVLRYMNTCTNTSSSPIRYAEVSLKPFDVCGYTNYNGLGPQG